MFKREFDDCISAAEEAYKLNHQTYDLVTRINPEKHYPEPEIYASGEENLVFATNQTTYFLLHPDLITLFEKGLTDYGQGEDVRDVRLDLYQQPNKAVKDYQFTLQYMPVALQYATNSVGLRTTEVMLMLGECYARKGKNDKVKEYMDACVHSAKEKGFVTTLLGRRREIPQLRAQNYNVRSFGERIAMNAPIQGSAADIIKLAMLNVHESLKNSGIRGQLILQVHDELILEVHQQDARQAAELLKEQMENVMALSVPLLVETNVGRTWFELK